MYQTIMQAIKIQCHGNLNYKLPVLIVLKINLNKRIDELKKKGIPTNFEELSVSGKDLMRKLKGPEIGQALTYIIGFAIRKMTNDRKLLLKELERKFSLKF